MAIDFDQLKIPFVGVGCIVTRAGQWLLVRGRTGHWSTPGGHLDFGESLEACAARETLEETGVTVTNVRFAAVTNDVMPETIKHYVTIWLRGEAEDAAMTINDPAEIVELGWFAPDTFPQPLARYFENFLAGHCMPSLPADLPLPRS